MPITDFSDFCLPALITGDWLRLGSEQLDMAVKALDEFPAGFHERLGLRQPIRRGRALPLRFWGDGWGLYDLEADVGSGAAALAFVVGPNVSFLIDGTAPPIHQVNHDLGLNGFANEAQALAYLRFFCGSVWGEAGPFAIVDTAQQAASWLKSPPPMSTGAERPLVTPAKLTGRDRATWLFSATVTYKGCLFESAFSVAHRRMIEMTDDKLLFDSTPALTFTPPHRRNFEVDL